MTDQSEGKDKKDDIYKQQIETLMGVVENLKAQNDRFFKLEEERRKRAEDRRRQKEEEDLKKKNTLFGRIFGAGGV